MLRQQEPKDVSLRAFFSPKDKVLAAFSIFGALTLLFAVITNELLYFISLFTFMVLGYELNTRFPSWRLSTIYLFLFRILCFIVYLGIIAYTIYFYFFSLGTLPFYLHLLAVYAFVRLALPRIKRFVHQHKTRDLAHPSAGQIP